MKPLILTFSLILSVTLASADEANHRKLAEDFLSITETDEQMQTMFDQMKLFQTQQMAEEGNNEEMLEMHEKMFDIMSQEMSWENIKEDYISLYVGEFSEEDLAALIDFYKSPAGQKYLQKMPVLMMRGMDIGKKRMLNIQPRIDALFDEYYEKRPGEIEQEMELEENWDKDPQEETDLND